MTRPDDVSSVYLDSCVLIDYVGKSPQPEVMAVMRLIDVGKLTAYISTLHYVEVLRANGETAFDPEQDRRIVELLRHPRMIPVEVAPYTAWQARDLATRHGLKPMDALHLAAAIHAEVDVLMTYDAKLLRLQRVGGVNIAVPYEPGPDAIDGL